MQPFYLFSIIRRIGVIGDSLQTEPDAKSVSPFTESVDNKQQLSRLSNNETNRTFSILSKVVRLYGIGN